MGVLVDSSVWIAASSSKTKEFWQLKGMIQKGESLVLIRPIQVEVTQGARDEQTFHQLWESFLGFPCIEVTDRLWGKSAWNYFLARKKGITPSTLDCLIATVAREHGHSVWSLDQIFKKLRPVLGFELFRP